MTRKERFLALLANQKADTLTWAPNFDHWYNVNLANHTLPPQYEGLSCNDIIRSVGGTIWRRTTVLRTTRPNVTIRQQVSDNAIRTTYETPVGSVTTLHQYAKDMTKALFLKEHMIKGLRDIEVVKFMADDTQFELDPTPFLAAEEEVGEDGICLVGLPVCLPYIQFGKTDAGWEQGVYLWYDHRDKVQELLEAYTKMAERAAVLLADSPAQVISSGDNMDEWTTPPNIFTEHGIPYYRRIAEILHRKGKTFQVHWCGRTKRLLPLVPETGIDVVEAVTVAPMDNLTIPRALDMVGDTVVIQGGIPSIMMCPQSATRDDLKKYVESLLKQVPIGYRYIMGMSDNVPPDADFDRVKMISDMVNGL